MQQKKIRYENLRKIEEAPQCGQMLVYTRKKVLFQVYAQLEDVQQVLTDSEILELHLFDDNREYRAVSSRSPRFEKGVIEQIITKADIPDDRGMEVFDETAMLVLESNSPIKVLNHIQYDEKNGMACIDNYRLKMGGK